MVLDNFLNALLGPLLNLPTVAAVLIISFTISLSMTFVYKLVTDQNLMKQLKGEMKDLQKQIKALKKEPEKSMEIQKKAMQTNMKYMVHSMRSTLFSIIPIILIFGWMKANFAYVPIAPGQDFAATVNFEADEEGEIELSAPPGIQIQGPPRKKIAGNAAKWIVHGNEGDYLLEFNFQNKKYAKEVLITTNHRYITPITNINDGFVKSIEIEHKPNYLFQIFGLNVGWLAAYIVSSILFSIGVRRIIKVH